MPYPKLTPNERLELLNDPNLQDPRNRMAVIQNLQAEDAQWLGGALDQAAAARQANAPPASLTDKLRDYMKPKVEATGQYIREHPAEAGAVALGVPMGLLTGGAGALPALAAAGTSGAAGAGIGMMASKQLDPQTPVSDSPSEFIRQMVEQGAAQTAGEGAGRFVLQPLLKGAGNALMRNTIGGQTKVANAFPDMNLAEVMNEYRFDPRGNGQLFGLIRSGDTAQAMRGASAARTQGLADMAAGQGLTIKRGDVLPWMGDSLEMAHFNQKAGLSGGPQDVHGAVEDLFNAQFPYGDISPSDAPGITQALQNRGRTAQNATNAGLLPTGLESATYQDLANGVRQTMNANVPGYAASNAETQKLIAANRIIENMSNPNVVRRSIGEMSPTEIGVLGAMGQHPLVTTGVAAVKAAGNTPAVSVPAAIALYQLGKIPYAYLLKAIGPAAARAAGIIPEHTFEPVSGVKF